jgi:hypothetical protein
MRISFDYDGTLADGFDGTPNDQKDRVRAKLRQLRSEGHEVYIVTRRYSPENSHRGLVNEHIDVLRLAADLGVPGRNIVFTNRRLKAATLVEMSIDQHYEDCDIELDDFLRNHASTSMNFVMVSRTPWQVVNSAAEKSALESSNTKGKPSGSTSTTTVTTTQLPGVTPGQVITSTPNLIKENSQHSSTRAWHKPGDHLSAP